MIRNRSIQIKGFLLHLWKQRKSKMSYQWLYHKSNWSYPVLQYEGVLALSDEEKDNMMVQVLATVQRDENLREDKLRRKEHLKI